MVRFILMDKRWLRLLFIINLLGTIYGFYWYKDQLAETPVQFLPFVPDSPTASLFFTIVILCFLLKKHAPYFEALAMMSLFKYGIWAVIMNGLMLMTEGFLNWQGMMLIGSHLAMAIQGILYAPFYRLKLKHIAVAAIFLLHNEIIDYVYGMMPSYASLEIYSNEIGYFTFWLSIFSIWLTYKLTIGRNKTINE